jgi:hypothetical protein
MAARSGLSNLITRLRGMTATGSADYTVGALTYWTDDQLEDVLDRNRLDVRDEVLTSHYVLGTAGTAQVYDYTSRYHNFESTTGGTAIFYLAFDTGERVGTALYTPDYDSGKITFAANTGGSVLYLNARAYDLNAAAAEVWTMKADHVADRFDFAADGATFKVSQLQKQYMQRAARYTAMAEWGNKSVSTHSFERGDMGGGW